MHQFNHFSSRAALDSTLAEKVSIILSEAVARQGKASIAVSGGSTPKGFFQALSQIDLPWQSITVTLADERWVEFDSTDSNTRLVHEYLLQNKAVKAKFFHLKQGDNLCAETLGGLNVSAHKAILPFDVLILGMGEDGHTASLFPCSEQIDEGLTTSEPLLKVEPTTAPHKRISFSFNTLKQSKNTILHICGEGKKVVLDNALAQ